MLITKDTRLKTTVALKASEDKFQSLTQSATDSIILANSDGNIIFWNQSAEKMFGYTENEAVGNNLEIIMPEKYRPRHREGLKRYMETGDSHIMGKVIELEGLRKDLSIFPIELSLSTWRSNGEHFFCGIIRDITNRQKAENKFRELLESAPDAMIITGKDGLIQLINAQTTRLFGYDREELIGKPIEILVPDRFRHGHPNYRKNYFSNPKTREMGVGMELYALRKDKTEFPVEISLSPIDTEDGKVALAAIRDITERKKIEAIKKEKEEEFRAIFNQAFIGIAKVSLEGKFIDCNERLTQIMGYSNEELRLKRFHDITHPDDLIPSEDYRQKLLNGEINNFTFEKRYITKAGEIINANITTILVRNSRNEPNYFVTVFDDVTEERLANEIIRKSLHEKELLIKEIHHRVKNNMQLIMSYMNLYSYKVENEMVKNTLKDCNNLIRTMALVHESLYKTDDFVNMNFSEYVDRLCDFFLETMAENKNILINKKMESTILTVDKATTCGLIINELLTNAFKHAFPVNDGIVTIGMHHNGDQLEIIISDNGIGIPIEILTHHKETFGMEMVNSLTEQLDGELITTVDHGTKHVLRFPVK